MTTAAEVRRKMLRKYAPDRSRKSPCARMGEIGDVSFGEMQYVATGKPLFSEMAYNKARA
jgi:hypothetical protein